MKTSNKKGEISGEVLMMIPRMIFLIAVLFTVVILVKVFIIAVTDIREIESNILINRLLYSANGLSYFDEELSRLYPGVINLEKFQQMSAINPNLLDSTIISYGSDNPIIAAKLTLKQKDKDDISLFYNKDRFDKWEPRTLSTVKGGAGSFKAFNEKRNIIVKDKEKIMPGILEFYIIS